MADVFDEITNDVAGETEGFLAEVVEDTKQRVSVPVEYVTAPRGGVRVIRSKPGEPPRKETGALQQSVTANVAQSGDIVTGYVNIGVPYSTPLEEDLDRLIVSDRLGDLAELYADRVAKAAG